jgi:hypothetical protein
VYPIWRVLWDAQREDWMRVFRPSRAQCLQLFDWVLDLIEDGSPPDASPVPGSVGTWSHNVESARAEVVYIVWPGEPRTIAFVEILSY